MSQVLSKEIVNGGYVATHNPLAARPGCLISGSRNILFDGDGRSQAYKGILQVVGVAGGRWMANAPDGGYASLGTAAQDGIGSIIGIIAKALGFLGQGPLYINGISKAINASTALQLLLFQSGSYAASAYIAGLDPPTAPTIAATPNASTVNSGTASAVIWFVRSATGGRSRKSTPSEVIVVDGKTVRLTVSGVDLTTAATFGYDRIGIGVTQWGFGAAGNFYAYPINSGGEIAISSLTTVDGVANSYELDWATTQLNGQMLAPLDDDPPPAAVFAVVLEDVAAVIGAYGDSVSGVTATTPGTAIAVSLPVYIESFPPDSLLFLPEPPVGVVSRPSGGFAFIGCKNSTHALTYKGGTPALSLQTIFANIGIASPHNMFLGEGGRLYMHSNGKRGLVRIGDDGNPETDWAMDVADDIAVWDSSKTVGGFDNDHQCDIFGNDKTLYALNSQSGKWSTPLDISGAITGDETLAACVSVDGSLLLAVRDTVNTANPMRLFSFNEGTGTTAEAMLPWQPSQNVTDVLTEVHVAFRADNTTYPVTLKAFTNGDEVTPKATRSSTLPRTGQQHLTPWRPNVRGAKSHSIYFSQRSAGGDDAGIDMVTVKGVTSGVVQ